MLKYLIKFYPKILFIIEGTLVTLKYSIIAVILGLVIGMLLAICKVNKNCVLRLFANFYTSIFRGTPLLVQLSIIYFAAPYIISIKFSVFMAGVISFALNSGAYVSEVIRAGINTIDKGQFEAAEALAIPKFLIMKDIILPQAINNIFPSLVNELINLIKESAIISMLGEMDLMRRAQIVSIETYNYFFPMLIAACCYYILVMLISFIAKIIEKKMIVN
ncbi:amino acid ABC transporter permease [Rickettsia typhi]|uniref:Putative glutamine transport system permease protein GlnP n=2 Tax=Rickettsia typhi TaxID=785 RepID=GLNP_RICTY|nr:amino acid ABC transporter permease [Rickettsia typhi]Q68XN8.1 RecName: Full=Putative glutamine transport system permease protein GlnP [Rickettsia typhi str. Wilmington]AAU03604.1 glutamine transport system permease protein GlnP [Rickettsia typhi str. Wilmington]AFE53983.1 glutamine transport system permease protein GlnP [Rickettsia typhi str. TH1527]AFE54822.1 glutamine transport system permease protein GlnP [Rickettsia typhi str. B9991CWPP]